LRPISTGVGRQATAVITRNSISVPAVKRLVATLFKRRLFDSSEGLTTRGRVSSHAWQATVGRGSLPGHVASGIPLERVASHTLSPGLSVWEMAFNLRAVQRLFSMFPTGAAGVALVLLRVSVAVTLVTDALPVGNPDVHAWEFAGLGLLGGALCLGVFTPASSVLSCVVEIASASDLKGVGITHLISSILITASLAMLGPGAYSVDARMFGRRLVVSSSDNRMNND
jgi:hypothetical protein